MRAGLSFPEPLAGVASVGGFYQGAPDVVQAHRNTPVLMIHGKRMKLSFHDVFFSSSSSCLSSASQYRPFHQANSLGTADKHVRYSECIATCDMLAAMGVTVHLQPFDGDGHFIEPAVCCVMLTS